MNPARRRALSFLPSLFPYAGLAVWGFLRSARAEDERRTFIEIPPQSTDDAEGIEVREFFYYGCGACYAFEPYLREWEEKKAKDVLLVRTPALRTTRWIPLTKVYLVLLKLGAHLRLHQEVFDAYHFDNIDLGNGPVFADWAVSKGLEREAVQRWWDSKEIAAGLEVTYSVTRRYYVQSVPTLIIDGRYLTSPALAGGQKETITVIEGLIDRRRRERPPSST